MDNDPSATALAFAASVGLRDCTVKSAEPSGSNWLVFVEGMFTVEEHPGASQEDKDTLAAFLRESFTLKVVVSRGNVLKHEWLGIETDDTKPDEIACVDRYLRLVLTETMHARSARVRFRAETDRIVVSYDDGGEWRERDHPPVRLWHTLLAAIHSLIGDSLIGSGPTDPESSPPINTVLLNPETCSPGSVFPASTAVEITFQFSQTEVILAFAEICPLTPPPR